jgi:sec-independent protein translocase protein TatA
MRFGPLEIIGILVIIILIFGPGRISKIAGEIGTGIREFRRGIKGTAEGSGDAEDEDADTKHA